DAPEDPARAVADGVVPRRVQAHDPVSLAPAARGCIQRIVVGQRTQAAEGVPNGRFCQGAQPEPPSGLPGAASELQDVAEDELPFAAGVRSTGRPSAATKGTCKWLFSVRQGGVVPALPSQENFPMQAWLDVVAGLVVGVLHGFDRLV